MKKRSNAPLHRRKKSHTFMLLALLAPTLLSSSLVFAEDNTATEQSMSSEAQESTETTESTLESSTTMESSSTEESAATALSVESETTPSTLDSTTIVEADSVTPTPKAATVAIADPLLIQAILTTLGLPAGSELTQADMERLTSLSLSSAQIVSLSGLENALNLDSIFLNGTTGITDFSPLEQLSSLTYVTLQTKSLTSANFPDLSKSTGITNLSLGSTSIDNNVLPKIAQLTSLSRLYLDSNMGITTLEPLKALPNLRSLSAQFCGIIDFTVINDFPMLSDLAAFGQNTGRNDLPTTIGRSALSYDFDQQSLFIPFSLMPNRLTNFDNYVPPFSTSNSASNTYLDFNGTQLPANRLQITDLGITISGVSEDELKNLANFKYNARLNNPAGSYAQPAGFTFYAISSGTYLHQFNVVDDGKPVTVNYQDIAGNELKLSEERQGLVGQSFEIQAPDILGYELHQTIGNPTGTFSDQEQTVTFVYKEIAKEVKGTVSVNYVDTNNVPLRAAIDKTEIVGTPFTTEQLVFKGYTFKEVQGNTTGFYTEKKQSVTYIYTKDENKTDPTTSTDSSIPPSDTTTDTTDTTTSSSESNTQNSSGSVQKDAPKNSQPPRAGTKSNLSAKKRLPATGEQSNYAWFVLGTLLIGFVHYRYIFKKVKQDK